MRRREEGRGWQSQGKRRIASRVSQDLALPDGDEGRGRVGTRFYLTTGRLAARTPFKRDTQHSSGELSPGL